MNDNEFKWKILIAIIFFGVLNLFAIITVEHRIDGYLDGINQNLKTVLNYSLKHEVIK